MRKRKTISQKVYSTGGPHASLYEENRRLEGKLRAIGAYDEELPKKYFCLFMGNSIMEVSKEDADIMNARELTIPQAEEWANKTNRRLCLKK